MNFDIQLFERDNKLYISYYQNGKRYRKSLKMEATKLNIKYAQKNIIPNFQAKLLKGEEIDKKKITLKYYLDRVIEKSKNLKLSTQYLYGIVYKKLIDYFGDVDIRDIKSSNCEQYINSQNVSPKSIRLYVALLNLAFKLAIKDDVLLKNPLEFSDKPKLKESKKIVFNVIQINTILEKSKGKLKIFLYIAFFTGMRSGEILGLKWEDIDFDSNQIHIQRAVKNGVIDLPKTNKTRVIPLILKLKEFLEPLKSNGYILQTTNLTNYYSGVSFLNSFKLLQKKLCYTNIASIHITRHTFASLMLQAGENPTLIKNFLGHSNLDMINKVYLHYIESKQDTKKFEKLLNFGTFVDKAVSI